jgi:pimeloyl-ACP methyl ester carboxylesterase
MSALMLNNGLVHYEAWGRGQPILFLHSWLGSWRYWVPTMEEVADRHRVYALDFWGFGESDGRGCSFTIQEYVELLFGFIDKQGLREINLVGHGLGGMVAVRAATSRPELFAKVTGIGMPLQGSAVSHIARTGTFSRLFGASRPSNIWSKVLRQMNLGNAEIYREMQEDTDNLSEELVQRVLESVQGTDLIQAVQELKVPVLLVYGDRDTVVGLEHYERLKAQGWRHNSETSNGASDWEAPIGSEDGQAHALILRQSGHFPFIDQEYTFNRLLLDYLAQESTLAIKKAWRRRVTQREYL